MVFVQSSLDTWLNDEYLDDTVDLYSPTEGTISAGGRGMPDTMPATPTIQGVKAKFIPTNDYEDLDSRVLMQTQNTDMTQDRWHFPVTQAVATGWAIVMKTVKPDGSHHSLYGRVWNVQGESRDFNNENHPAIQNEDYKEVWAKIGPGIIS